MQKDIDLIRKLKEGVFDMPSGLQMDTEFGMSASSIS
jgi:hypothetical protein